MANSPRRRYFVTGSSGCLGAWVVRHLTQRGQRVVGFDIRPRSHRVDLLVPPAQRRLLTEIEGDLAQSEQVVDAVGRNKITHIIHLAALQVPFCRADPVGGARVNVVGTVNVFEAARRCEIPHLTFASSVAVYGAPEDYPPGPLQAEAPLGPRTLYGVYKQANEGTARNYWEEHGISSVCLRPHTVYGVGRDQGITSDPTRAMLAAVAGRSFEIPFANRLQFQLASDVALQFIDAASAPERGFVALNLLGEATGMEEMVRFIREEIPEARVSHTDTQLPFLAACPDNGLSAHFEKVHQTPTRSGVRQTIEMFRELLESGLLKF